MGVGAMSISTTLARHIVRQLIELGIEDAVLSPGSRNAPLSLALYQAEERGLMRLHVRIDERGAAFFALGISKATGKYVPVICTSGTAVANYYPATLEAYHSNTNLLLLTADRPAQLRKTGSNQTTLQNQIFGSFVRHSVDTAAPIDLAPLLSESGPVHINLQFAEPLLPQDSQDWLSGIHARVPKSAPLPASSIETSTSKNILIVGHDRAGFNEREIEELARELHAPIVSEDPLRFKDAIAHSPIVLSDEGVRNKLKPELAVIIGRTTLSRATNSYIQIAERTVVIDPRTSNIDTARSATEILHSIPKVKNSASRNENWWSEWQKFETLAKQALETYPAWSEGALASIVAADLENDSALFIASSRPIRDLEAFATPRADVITYANRGLAGIDGNVSTALGIASHHDETYAIIGDLAFLHDISALANPTKDVLTIIVVDNNGGGIFSTLPQRGVTGFEKVFGTPHNQDLAKIVAGFGISHEIVTNPKELHIALQRIHPNIHVIIAKMPDREANADALTEVLTKYKELVVL
jgi:2-succinyl-5-enolpyruvyl-6-hydroxy-3-cyclohexene-1-carboxylate synthase